MAVAQAPVHIERQPEECRSQFREIRASLDEPMILTLNRWRRLLHEEINPLILRCWQFSESQRVGLANPQD